MNKVNITLEETIPHYDPNGVIMQMVNFRFAVSWEQEENESLEDLRNKVYEEFQKSREYCYKLTPIAELKNKKFTSILNELIALHPELKNEIKNLINKY